jgi:hypothetical protein
MRLILKNVCIKQHKLKNLIVSYSKEKEVKKFSVCKSVLSYVLYHESCHPGIWNCVFLTVLVALQSPKTEEMCVCM